MFWDRRGSRGNRRMPGGRADLFRLVLALAATRPVFTANNVVVLAGKVVDIIDWNDATHVLTQSESGKQCLAPAARASFANQLVCDLDGSAEYTSNRTAAQAAFLQQDGSFLSAVGAPRSTTAGNAPFRIGTKNWAGVAVGFHFDLFNEAGPICRAYANTANGTAVVNGSNSAALVTVDNPLVADTPRVTSWFSGVGTWEVRSKGAVVASGSSAAAPSASAPASPISLQAGANTRGYLAVIFMAPAPGAAWSAYTQQTYGLAA